MTFAKYIILFRDRDTWEWDHRLGYSAETADYIYKFCKDRNYDVLKAKIIESHFIGQEDEK